ncbi:hypothetical protein ILUMI_27263 [Ignelater luminosus]|uniref:Uncharacterized protein n=1 Tax=Ignelater luminosus TaxID=2038154 RepID=A0A8K0C3L2_IGNLU|nr:hypothetical protein ILUMI_27263 [Ignelater luminosus]
MIDVVSVFVRQRQFSMLQWDCPPEACSNAWRCSGKYPILSVPESVLENSPFRLYSHRSLLTDRTIPANMPDIVLTDKGNRTTYLIDIAIPNTNNIQDTVATKISKYTDQAYEI